MARMSAKNQLSGAVGNVIFYESKGKMLVRSSPKKIKNPQTPAQQEHRMRFALASRFVKPFRPLFEQTFVSFPGKSDGFGAAMSYNMRFGIMGKYPTLEIDYSKALISFGGVELPSNLLVTKVNGGVQISWDSNAPIGANLYDWVVPVLLADNVPLCQVLDGVGRGVGSCTVPLDGYSKTYQIWVFVKSQRGKAVSASWYGGTITALEN